MSLLRRLQVLLGITPPDISAHHVRRTEVETYAKIRDRRREVRLALARREEREAQQKRQMANSLQATYIDETDEETGRLYNKLMSEAAMKEHTAKALREGEIGFLEALGVEHGDPDVPN